VVFSGGVSEVLDNGGGVDGAQQNTAESGAWTLWSIASPSGRKVRTEWSPGDGGFG
jgi:hypothetical protein